MIQRARGEIAKTNALANSYASVNWIRFDGSPRSNIAESQPHVRAPQGIDQTLTFFGRLSSDLAIPKE